MKKIIITILTLFLLSPIIVRADITTGLVGYWKMDEGSGNVTVDETAYGNDGLITNATWVTDGRYDDALQWTGTYGENVNVTGDPSLNMGGLDMTISAWIKLDTYHYSDQPIISKGDGGVDAGIEYFFGVGIGGCAGNLTAYWGQWWDETFCGNTKLQLDELYHVVWVKNSTHGIFYINNTVDDIIASATPIYNYTSNVLIGNEVEAGAGALTYPFNGTIDEVRIYNRALSESDVSELFSFDPTPPSPTTTTTTLGAVGQTLSDVGEGTGNLFRTISVPITGLIILISIGLFVGAIFTQIGKSIGGKI